MAGHPGTRHQLVVSKPDQPDNTAPALVTRSARRAQPLRASQWPYLVEEDHQAAGRVPAGLRLAKNWPNP